MFCERTGIVISHIKYACSDNESWCGEQLPQNFYFKDAEHAALNGLTNGGLIACDKCVNKIIKYLKQEELTR